MVSLAASIARLSLDAPANDHDDYDVRAFVDQSHARLVPVALEYSYLSVFLDRHRPPPAIAYGVATDQQVHFLLIVDEVDTAAGWAGLRLVSSSGGGELLDMAAAFLLGLEYVFRVTPVDRVLVSLAVKPGPDDDVQRSLGDRLVARVAGKCSHGGGRRDEVLVSVSRADLEWL